MAGETAGVDFDVVVLAGGAGTRMGGADKAGLTVGGVSLLDRVLMASAAARHTVVVGVPRPTTRVVEWTLEQPPGGGPVAGLAAGVAVLERAMAPAPVLVLATDLPHLGLRDVERLVAALSAAGPQVEGAVFVDDAGAPQFLTAIYRRAELVQAIADEQPVAGRPMRALLNRLTTIGVPDHGAAADVDTAEQLSAARGSTQRGSTKEVAMTDDPLAEWVATVCAETGLDPAAVDIPGVLDLAKDAAHGIARPAAPLTTFMAGYLAGRAAGRASAGQPASVTRAALAQLTALVPPPPTLD